MSYQGSCSTPYPLRTLMDHILHKAYHLISHLINVSFLAAGELGRNSVILWDIYVYCSLTRHCADVKPGITCDAGEITRLSKMGVLTGNFSDYVPLLIEGILGRVWYLIVSIPDLCNLITLVRFVHPNRVFIQVRLAEFQMGNQSSLSKTRWNTS